MHLLTALFLLLPVPAAASQPPRDPVVGTGPREPWRPTSARTLHRLCTDARDGFARCDTYITAIGDARSSRPGPPTLCPLRLRALAHTRAIVVRHIETLANREVAAAPLVEQALRLTYPCSTNH